MRRPLFSGPAREPLGHGLLGSFGALMATDPRELDVFEVHVSGFVHGKLMEWDEDFPPKPCWKNMKKPRVSVKFFNTVHSIFILVLVRPDWYILAIYEKFLKWGIPILGHLPDSFSDFMLYFFLVPGTQPLREGNIKWIHNMWYESKLLLFPYLIGEGMIINPLKWGFYKVYAHEV